MSVMYSLAMNHNITNDVCILSLLVGWLGMLAGAITGAGCGLFFHREDWLGGYGSYRRRLLRLGHISCFGVGFLNVLFALTQVAVQLHDSSATAAFLGFALAMVTMPACCFLSAWKQSFRHLFPIPVIALTAGVLGCLDGLWRKLIELL